MSRTYFKKDGKKKKKHGGMKNDYTKREFSKGSLTAKFYQGKEVK
jgi:hypothetical protein